MLSEIRVRVKNTEKTLTDKSLVYETFSVCETDAVLRDCVDRAVKQFGNDEIDDVSVTIKLVWQ